jgi:hypothetical protein
MKERLWFAIALSCVFSSACSATPGRWPASEPGVTGAAAPAGSLAPPPQAGSPAAPPLDASAARIERGRYLVMHVAGCPDCHSPKTAERHPDPQRHLAGVDCFVDAAPADPEAGCLSSANLTHSETGLKNRTDAQIKAMILRGVRPDGKALHPFMPYAYFGNMREDDADAIVAYLRTVPGVEHTVASSQAPFLPPKQPVARVPEPSIPLPRADYPEREAALRGRYLAGNVGSCLACHTPRGKERPLFERAFQGGLEFRRAALGLPPSFPEVVYSSNLTPHATGIAGYAVRDLVRALKHGEDPNQRGSRLCPPMPAGPLGTFGGLTEGDATDIAHYLLSLPPAEHAIPNDCRGAGAGVEHAKASMSEAMRRLSPFVRAPDDPRHGALWLSETGLYEDIAKKRTSPLLRAFEPAYALYSDGAQKRRWLALPANTRIDSSDPANWSFPVGTLLFKEFARGGRRIETRVLARTGPGADDFFMGAFAWKDDESDALFVQEGKLDPSGHQIPSAASCWSCHGGEPSRVLGFSAVQQPRVPGELLSSPIPRAFEPPGDETTRQALGYLHANCGHCHNPRGSARPDTDLDLALRPGDTNVFDTGAYRTAIGRPLTAFKSARQRLRIAAGAPDASALVYRMSQAAPEVRMPPLASTQVDAEGVALLRRWVERL